MKRCINPEIYKVSAEGFEDKEFTDFEEAETYYESLESKDKALWETNHMELIRSSQDDNATSDNGSEFDDLPF